MSSIIQLLPDHVANQIAAGEVVQRPSSVVKELVENAVDAGATDIKLIVKDAGKTLIHVIDNGKGMNVTDARLCFERHATSKIRQAEDLFALHTKGFRGEALASIAAIAHVELKTKQAADELGTHIIMEGSNVLSQEVAVIPNGTSFLIKNLFYNIPARRNFLKSDSVEFRHVVDDFERVALAHPEIHFTLIHNGSEVFNLPISNLRQRLVNVFGGKTNEKLVPVHEDTDLVSIRGFVGKPEFAKKNRGEQFFFVNERYIKSHYLHHAIMSAFEGLLKDGSQPSYFLFLDVPPNSIDINIHPTKTEIKFDDEQALYAILRAAVKHGIGQFSVANAIDFDRDHSLDLPVDMIKKEAVKPTIDVDTSFNPFKEEEMETSQTYTSKLSASNFSSYSGGSSKAFGNGNPFDTRISTQEAFDTAPKKTQERFQEVPKSNNTQNWESLYVNLKADTAAIDETLPSKSWDTTDISFESDEVTGSLFESIDDTHQASKRTYQIHKKYIISPIKSGMMILNQQRAHQRVLFEQFLENITLHKAPSQQLLFPLQLYFSNHEMRMIEELRHDLEHMGFMFEQMNSDNVLISGLPVTIIESEVAKLIEILLIDLQDDFTDKTYNQADQIAKSMARSLSIKTGTALNEEEQENLVNSLFGCKEPNISPFNKPTFITLDVTELDKKFAL